MTLRLRSSAPTRRRRSLDPEDRYQFWVTIEFIVLIVSVILVLVVSIGLGYYNDHLKPIASVGGQSISPDAWGQRIRLESYRLAQEEQRLRTALTQNPDDATRLQAQLSDVQSKQATETVAEQSANDLVDLMYQAQLASQNGVTVTDADVDAQKAEDASTPEQRHVLAIMVDPAASETSGTATSSDQQTAYDNAQKAAAALAAGQPFDQVAKQYSTDESKDKGGDLGWLDATDTTDPTWDDALFRLAAGGVTPVIKGDDGVYRIGQVTEIKPGAEDPNFASGAIATVGDGFYRDQLRLEAIADKLETKITDDQLGKPVDQYNLDEIKIAMHGSDPLTDEQVKAAHILYSPNDDPQNQASLAPDDPAWTAAKDAAQKVTDELNAITDITQREARFAEIAKVESDDTASGADGGELGTFTKADMVSEFADPLFSNSDLKAGDIVGPVKSDFGYHVILFEDRIPSSTDRVGEVKTALAAPGADFAAIAKQFSDGDEALSGGERGWQVGDQLPAEVLAEIKKVANGQVTGSIQTDDAFYFEKVDDHAQRAPEGQPAAQLAATAFQTWYATQKDAATKDDTIQTNKDIFTVSASPAP